MSAAYRAVGPWLEGAVVVGLHGLNRNVLVAVERRNNGGLVSQSDPVRGVRREQALEEGGRRVEDGCAFTADLDANVDLLEVDEVAVDAPDVRGRTGVQVEVAEVRSKLVRLGLDAKGRSSVNAVQRRTQVRRSFTSPSGVLWVYSDFWVMGSW